MGRTTKKRTSSPVGFFNDICEIYESYENHLGGCVKPVIFTFVWAGICANHLGATAMVITPILLPPMVQHLQAVP